MAKYRGLAPWALGLAVLAHACASATGLIVREDEVSSVSSNQPLRGAQPGVDHASQPRAQPVQR